MQRTGEAKFLPDSHPEVATWIEADSHQARLRVPVRFAEDIRQWRLANLSSAIHAGGGEAPPRGQRLARLCKAWAPRGERRVIESMRPETDPDYRAPTRTAQAAVLKEHWGQAFACRETLGPGSGGPGTGTCGAVRLVLVWEAGNR